MAWQRKIPFGYMIQNGQAACHPTETNALKDIYRMYLSGLSYQRIADTMERRGIKYHQHTEHWNKYMVKRVLENETYLGTKLYPRIISNDDFLAVSFRKADRTSGAPCSDYMASIRKKAVCVCCGMSMKRRGKARGHSYWHCENPECGQTVHISDDTLHKEVVQRLRELAAKPQLLTLPVTPPQTDPSIDAIRIQNELNMAFNRGSENRELIRALIYAAAAESYSMIPDPTPSRQLEQLKERLEACPTDDGVLRDILDTAVIALYMDQDGTLDMELANGKRLKSNGEEKPA